MSSPDFSGSWRYYHLTGQYYRLTSLGDRTQAVPLLDRGGTTAGSNNCRRYYCLTGAVPPPRALGRPSLPGGATVDQEFRAEWAVPFGPI